MSQFNRRNQFVARLMLVLAALQFAFVSFEFAGFLHVPVESHSHLEVHGDANQSSTSHHNSLVEVDVSLDTCDHGCHGHGSHSTPLSSHDVHLAELDYAALSGLNRTFDSVQLEVIHRPPIV